MLEVALRGTLATIVEAGALQLVGYLTAVIDPNKRRACDHIATFRFK
jgi:hypothetical protein